MVGNAEAVAVIVLCSLLLPLERTGIEPVTSDLQIPGSSVELGQVRSITAKLRWLGAVKIGYSGTRFGTRFCVRATPGSNGAVACSFGCASHGSLASPSVSS